MNPTDTYLLDFAVPEPAPWVTAQLKPSARNGTHPAPLAPPSQDFLRACAWEIGEHRSAERFTPTGNHVGLAMVTPYQGFAQWRILQSWVDTTAWHRGEAWRNCRLVLRLYDVSYIEFNGLNAHSLADHNLPCLCGQMFFRLPQPGTSQLGEVGFLLRNGEFVPAARSQAVQFARDAGSRLGSQAALLVKGKGEIEEIDNLWEQDKVLRERRQRRLRRPLRIAVFTHTPPADHQDGPGRFIAELARGQRAQGHEVHLIAPRHPDFSRPGEREGIQHHPLEVRLDGPPVETAWAFAQAAQKQLRDLPPFDLLHFHEWMSGLGSWVGNRPVVLSLTSTETRRRNAAPPTELSLAIQECEREAARAARHVLTPAWLREQAQAELGLDGKRIHAFPLEGRVPDQWDCPLDLGAVKQEIQVGPLDRLLLFVGPLEYAAGVDVLLEAMPVLLQRFHNLRLAYVGGGNLYGQLAQRAQHLRVAHAVRLLGHIEGAQVVRLLRAAEALVLPSRYRVPQDDSVVDLARRAGRAVITTHGGPAHQIRHEETGLVTYDNPGSMVWAVDRLLGDPSHAERLGRNGRHSDSPALLWGEVPARYLQFCAENFPELSDAQL